MRGQTCVRRAVVLVALLVGAVASGLFAPGVAAAQPSSLRLFTAVRSVTVRQDVLRASFADLGVWIAPVGGAFQINVTRPGYGAWTAGQVDPGTGSTLRRIPASLVNPALGLTRFFNLRFVRAGGRVAARHTADFCPSAESARVDDSGPDQQTYPLGCNSGFFPFVRGIVWGMDAGWAAEPPLLGSGFGIGGPFGFGPPPGASIPVSVLQRLGRHGLTLSPGRYTVLVSIASAYRRLFAVHPGQGSASVSLRVLPSPRVRTPQPTTAVGVSSPVRIARAALDRPASPSTTTAAPSTLPNLVALPAWRIGVHSSKGRELLTFSATIWNAGPAPLTLEGFRVPGRNLMDAYEYFSDSSGNIVGRARAGTMFYDNDRGHHHWHLRQLAAYTLIEPSGQVVRSQKQSFCIAPTDAVDLTVPGADRTPNAFFGLGFGGSTCDLYSPGAIWLREQLPVGWGDTYNQSVAGQAFDITHLPNGRYRIEVQVNPLGQLTETTTSDDVATRIIRLSGHGKARRVTVEPWHGIRS